MAKAPELKAKKKRGHQPSYSFSQQSVMHFHCIISSRTTVIKHVDPTALLESLELTALLKYFNYQISKGGLKPP